MPTRHLWVFGFCALVCGLARNTSAAAEVLRAPLGLDERVGALYDCYTGALQDLDEGGTDLPAPPDTDAYFFEQLSDPNLPLALGSIDDLCHQFFVHPLRQAAELDRMAQEQASPHAQAFVGTVGYLGENRLLGIAVKLGRLDHILGHSDITHLALERPGVAPFGPQAADFVARAAQAPDLWLWDSATAHALTPSMRGSAPTASDERRGQLAFLDHERELIARIEEELRASRCERALLLLGVALHGMQDLVFHRGMTFDEHAGLAYYLGKNPDLPTEPHFSRAIGLASEVSVSFLQHLERRIGRGALVSLGQCQPLFGPSLPVRVRALFPDAHPIGFKDMLDYWLVSLDYRFGSASKKNELQTAGRGRWPVRDITAELTGEHEDSVHRAEMLLNTHRAPFLQ